MFQKVRYFNTPRYKGKLFVLNGRLFQFIDVTRHVRRLCLVFAQVRKNIHRNDFQPGNEDIRAQQSSKVVDKEIQALGIDLH